MSAAARLVVTVRTFLAGRARELSLAETVEQRAVPSISSSPGQRFRSRFAICLGRFSRRVQRPGKPLEFSLSVRSRTAVPARSVATLEDDGEIVALTFLPCHVGQHCTRTARGPTATQSGLWPSMEFSSSAPVFASTPTSCCAFVLLITNE
jgi:hypothetical protein